MFTVKQVNKITKKESFRALRSCSMKRRKIFAIFIAHANHPPPSSAGA